MERVSKSSETVFMHDLPAMRGQDVLSEVLDGPSSIVFKQAQNKVYAAMAVLEWCIQRTEAVSYSRRVAKSYKGKIRAVSGAAL
jgi:aspartate carbamoyltransferase catalytic subunit